MHPESLYLAKASMSTFIYFCLHVFCIVYIVYIGLNLFKLKEFVTTDTELNAIAPPAIIGFSNPRAAIGMPIML